MPNLYCPSCGIGVKYLYNKPDNCSNCSHSFESPKISYAEKVEDDDEPVVIVENRRTKKRKKLSSINVTIDTPIFEKLGQVVGSSPGETRQKRKGFSKEELRNSIFKAQPSTIDDA